MVSISMPRARHTSTSALHWKETKKKKNELKMKDSEGEKKNPFIIFPAQRSCSPPSRVSTRFNCHPSSMKHFAHFRDAWRQPVNLSVFDIQNVRVETTAASTVEHRLQIMFTVTAKTCRSLIILHIHIDICIVQTSDVDTTKCTAIKSWIQKYDCRVFAKNDAYRLDPLG